MFYCVSYTFTLLVNKKLMGDKRKVIEDYLSILFLLYFVISSFRLPFFCFSRLFDKPSIISLLLKIKTISSLTLPFGSLRTLWKCYVLCSLLWAPIMSIGLPVFILPSFCGAERHQHVALCVCCVLSIVYVQKNRQCCIACCSKMYLNNFWTSDGTNGLLKRFYPSFLYKNWPF